MKMRGRAWDSKVPLPSPQTPSQPLIKGLEEGVRATYEKALSPLLQKIYFFRQDSPVKGQHQEDPARAIMMSAGRW